MYKFISISLLLCLFAISSAQDFSAPEDYYAGCDTLKGEELKTELHKIIKGHKVFPYFSDSETATKDILIEVDQDPQNPDNVICFYSGFSYPKNWQDIGRREDYSQVGTTLDNTWNREHVWSKSHGFPDREKDIAYTDVHNLRPADRTVNSAKGAKDFDWGGYANPEAENCFTDIDSWEAPDRVKGDIARCIFYMATRYEGTDTPYDLEPVDYTNTDGENYGRLSTLLEWHQLDPPDSSERRRNHLIFSKYQNNRNPFIDHPEFAFAIWGKPQYKPYLSTSLSDLYFTLDNNEELLSLNFTVVNHDRKTLGINVEAHNHIFSIVDSENYQDLPVENGYLNQQITIKASPRGVGNFVTNLCFYPYQEEVKLHATILPPKGSWLIDESFDQSLGEFTHIVISGNNRYSWHHSSWDNDSFAKLKGDYKSNDQREVWLISPCLDIQNFSSLYLNFISARNEFKSDQQLQVFLASEKPLSGVPDQAIELQPKLSSGNYNWENSDWMVIDNLSNLDKKQVYLLLRYFYDGDPAGQETWEIDDIKLYGVN